MLETKKTRCGLVAVLGAPNAGKSTLVNALVGQKVAIVSPKAQTTRTRLLGVAMEDETQLLLVDTPGIFDPRRRLDRAMVAAAWGGTEGADVLALVVDAKGGLGPKVTDIAERIADRPEPKFLVLNKVDLAVKPKLLIHAEKLNAAVNFAHTFFISAATGASLARRLPAKATTSTPRSSSCSSQKQWSAPPKLGTGRGGAPPMSRDRNIVTSASTTASVSRYKTREASLNT